MPPERHSSVAVAIFAKAPIEGFAKTRLISRLGAKGAADLQRHLIEHAVQVACAANVGPVSLWCSPDIDQDIFKSLHERYEVTLREQIGSDLGTRMHHAFVALTTESPALLMGTDCAVITPQQLVQCADLLRNYSDAVFVPVEDGGYILVGLKSPSPELFDAMPWGTERVMDETRLRARAAGLKLTELPPLWDIDRPEDYERAIQCGVL
ncbi:MAG: TIGR04282 family arsenosugar biosynthesis glycosyltransferase [Alphaproteobacteria bacterium]|nr:TIGR04282 family arsenosugar biosynthesis glycosyltransferase [Alphaproteobacteria bacterium]